MKKQSLGMLAAVIAIGTIVALGLLICLQDVAMPLSAKIFLAGTIGLTTVILMHGALLALTPEKDG